MVCKVKPTCLRTLLILLVIMGSGLIVNSFYMVAKAQFAQILLMRSWDEISTEKSRHLSPPWPWADFYPVAKLTFERLGITHLVLNNDSGQALAFGPGLTSTNTLSVTNMNIISGHNDSHFSVLARVKVGDLISLTSHQGKSRYFRVNKFQVIDTRVSQLNVDKEESALILVTCYPFGGTISATPHRLVVFSTPIMRPR